MSPLCAERGVRCSFISAPSHPGQCRVCTCGPKLQPQTQATSSSQDPPLRACALPARRGEEVSSPAEKGLEKRLPQARAPVRPDPASAHHWPWLPPLPVREQAIQQVIVTALRRESEEEKREEWEKLIRFIPKTLAIAKKKKKITSDDVIARFSAPDNLEEHSGPGCERMRKPAITIPFDILGSTIGVYKIILGYVRTQKTQKQMGLAWRLRTTPRRSFVALRPRSPHSSVILICGVLERGPGQQRPLLMPSAKHLTESRPA